MTDVNSQVCALGRAPYAAANGACLGFVFMFVGAGCGLEEICQGLLISLPLYASATSTTFCVQC
jgi:hypothetical protein